MKHVSFFTLLLAVGCLAGSAASAQSFRKGSLLVSLSEGSTHTQFTTTDVLNDNTKDICTGNVNGDRDPITVEYGLSDHWGIGLNMGADIFQVDPARFYHFAVPNNHVNIFTSEITAEVHYHFLVTKRFDLSAVGSVGLSGVTIKGNEGDRSYQYNAGGGIVRLGAKARYYVFRRFGLLGMVSVYSASYSPEGIQGNTVAVNTTTSIRGYAIEFGPCFRILK